jgi:hypothetical protein
MSIFRNQLDFGKGSDPFNAPRKQLRRDVRARKKRGEWISVIEKGLL